jgi:hypothetical protein
VKRLTSERDLLKRSVSRGKAIAMDELAYRLDQALQRRQAALEPRLRTAYRVGAQLLSPAIASRIAKCPASGGKPTVAVWLNSPRPSPTPHAASKITRLLVSCAS